MQRYSLGCTNQQQAVSLYEDERRVVHLEHGRSIALLPEFHFSEEKIVQVRHGIAAEIFRDDGIATRRKDKELAQHPTGDTTARAELC
jgi:hypothetical protein